MYYLFPKYYAYVKSSEKIKIIFRHGLFRQHEEIVGEIDKINDVSEIWDIVDKHHSRFLPNQIKSIFVEIKP